MSRISIIGTGYVGLTAGACFAHLGHQVICYDIDKSKIDNLSNGRITIVEEGLQELVKEGLESQNLSFVSDVQEGVSECDVAFLCVPTPQNVDGTTNISFLDAAVKEIAEFLPPDSVVVNKSTVPVGSAQLVLARLRRSDVSVVSNPEFLREGSAVKDFLKPERIIIGAEDSKAAGVVAGLYEGLDVPVLITDPTSAETIKYSANAFLVTKLSFVNSIAALCESIGADIDDVMRGISYDSRIGSDYLNPGPGWGGSCFPKDTRSLLHMAGQAGYDFRFLDTAVAVNEEQFDRVAEKIREAVGGNLDNKTVAVWGLTFKAGTDDLRDSPSLAIISRIRSEGALVQAHDPTVQSERQELDEEIVITDDSLEACRGADVLVLLTEWDEYKNVDPTLVLQALSSPNLVDARNIFNRDEWEKLGFTYRGIGR